MNSDFMRWLLDLRSIPKGAEDIDLGFDRQWDPWIWALLLLAAAAFAVWSYWRLAGRRAGRIVLAVVRNAPLSKFDRVVFGAGCTAAVIGALIGIAAFKSVPFKIAFTIMFAAVAWLCWRAWQFRELRELIVQAFQATMRITAMVAFILVGATCFSITFQGVDGNQWVEHLMSGLPGGVWGFLIVVNVFIFFLAFFLDFFEIAFIILPMVAPIAQKVLTPVGADGGADRAEGTDAGRRAGCCADLVRRHALRQHADLVPASAVRLCAVLFARRCAEGSKELRHLLGRHTLDRPAGDHGRDRDRLPDHGDRSPR